MSVSVFGTKKTRYREFPVPESDPRWKQIDQQHLDDSTRSICIRRFVQLYLSRWAATPI